MAFINSAPARSSLSKPLLNLPHPKPPSPRRLTISIIFLGISAMMLFYLLLSLAPYLISASSFHGYTSPWSFDANKSFQPKWMSKHPDLLNISSLSIPGTHDTMTYHIDKFSLQCQNWDLMMQMDAGIRYLDIRARLNDGKLWIYHADEPTGFPFHAVLSAMNTFLTENPSEFLIMRLKEEGKPLGHHRRDTKFEDAFINAIDTKPVTRDRFFFYNDSRVPLPTLGEVRSKIFMFQEFRTKEVQYGMPWNNTQMILEDKWVIDGVDYLPEKWEAIENALNWASTMPLDNQHMHVTHVSASVGLLPIEAAAGPLNRTQVGMNDKTGEWVEKNRYEPNRTVGVLIFDFPGSKLIDNVIKWNKLLWKGPF